MLASPGCHRAPRRPCPACNRAHADDFESPQSARPAPPVPSAATTLVRQRPPARQVSFESHVYETKEPIHGVGIGLKGDRAYAAGQSAELQLGPGEAWTDRAGKLHPWTQDLLRWLALREGWEPRLPARAQAAATSG